MRRLLASAAAERVRNLVLGADGPDIGRVAFDVRAGNVSLDEAALILVREIVDNDLADVRIPEREE
jgi:hypothetical protein